MKFRSRFIFFAYEGPIALAPFVEKASFLNLGTTLSKIKCVYSCVTVSEFSNLFNESMYLSPLAPNCLDYYSYGVSFEIGLNNP